MSRTLLALCCLCFCGGVSASAQQEAEVSKLKARIQTLEAENQRLRDRLSKIAALAARPTTTARGLSIVVATDDWGGAQKADVLKVLQSASQPLWLSSGKPSLRQLDVSNDRRGPMAVYRRAPNENYRVLVNVNGRRWAQLSFQFAHEFSHVLSNYRNVPNRQMWFEESICECASLYSLRRMGETWKTNPPYSNWASYAGSLSKYANDRIAATKPVQGDDLAKWYADNKKTLDATSTNRELNLVVACRLLKIFEKSPGSWSAVRKLNMGDPRENQSLETYLAGWHSRVDVKNRKMVAEIAKLFGISVHASAK